MFSTASAAKKLWGITNRCLLYTSYLYNPRTAYYKNTKNKQALNNRISDVLKKMYSAGYITKEEMEEAQNDTFTVIEESAATEMYDMPHFTEYAVYDVVTHMLRKEGLEDNSQNRSADVYKRQVQYAFDELNIDEITAQIRPDNLSSRRLAEKLGMIPKKEFTKIYKGKEIKHILYSRTK